MSFPHVPPFLFALGRLVATPGALAAMEENSAQPAFFLARHASGDWGELCAEDKRLNDQALLDGNRILSKYTLLDGATAIYVITEADRSATTILLPDEY